VSDLILPLKREYFEAIRDGSKLEEFRLANAYWSKRLLGRSYSRIVLTLGYPAWDDADRRLVRPWRGFLRKTITHPHFGSSPVEVFAIDVEDHMTPQNLAREGALRGATTNLPPALLKGEPE
jgi:hypothetical protein